MPLFHRDILCVLKKELIGLGISDKTVWSGLHRQKRELVNCWPHHKEGKNVYIHYNGMRNEYKQLIKEKLCNGYEPEEYLKIQAEIDKEQEKDLKLSSLETTIIAALDNYHPFVKHYHDHGTEKSKTYAQACSVIISVCNYMQSNDIPDKSLVFIKKLIPIINDYSIKLPGNARRLQEKIKSYINGDPVHHIIKVPRVGNKNRSLFKQADEGSEQTIKSWMVQLADGHNYSDHLICKTIHRNCEIEGFNVVPSMSTLQNWLNDPKIKYLTYNERFGDNNRKSIKYNGYTPTSRPLNANDVWQIDGTRVNLIPHTAVARNGTKKDAFLYIIAIRDLHSGDIVGEYYGYVENRWAYLAALHAACTNTGALPNTLILDKFPGHNTEEWKYFNEILTNRYGVKVFYTHKATGKAQIERSFGTLQTVFMQQSSYYYGEGVKSTRKSSHRTELYIKEAIKQAKSEGFDFEKAVTESWKIIEAYRHTPLSEYSRKYAKVKASPAQLFHNSDKPNQRALNEVDMVRLFWLRKELEFSRQMFKTEILKEECIYFNHDIDFIKYNTGKRFEIRYDAYDLENIHVFDLEKGEFIVKLDRFTPGIPIGPGSEKAKINQLRTARKVIENSRKAERAKLIESAPEVKRPELPEPKPELVEITSLQPMTAKKELKESSESDYLFEDFGYEKEKDMWEISGENLKIPGVDDE